MTSVGWGGVEDVDNVGMDLLQRDEREVGAAEGGLKAAAVFENVFARVPVGEPQVEHFFAFKVGCSARPCRESVNEPRQFAQSASLQDL